MWGLRHVTSQVLCSSLTVRDKDAMEFCLFTLHRGTSLAYLMAGKKNHLDNHMFSQRKIGKHLCSTPTLFYPLGLPHNSLDSLVSIPFHPASLDFRRKQQTLRKESIDVYVCVLSNFSRV